MVTDEQLERYARHIVLREVGGAGQAKLLASRVLVIGAGGLGSPLILYLAAAGIGTIGIVDFDRVSLSNLQRQIAHRTQDVGRLKTDSASDSARAINPDVKLIPHAERLTAANAAALIVIALSFPLRVIVNIPVSIPVRVAYGSLAMMVTVLTVACKAAVSLVRSSIIPPSL
jgi:molybdopterin/thiamine biosynthesis adenylyltransferase